jgi:hypothetical protein
MLCSGINIFGQLSQMYIRKDSELQVEEGEDQAEDIPQMEDVMAMP